MHTRIGPELRAKIAAVFEDICEQVADGAHVGNTLAKYGFKRGHLSAFLVEDPDARRAWDAAREQSAESFFDQAHEIIRYARRDPHGARVQFDALRWLAGKRNPRVYGEKSTVDLNVRTVDLTRVIADAQARLDAQRAIGHVVQGEVVRAALPTAQELDSML